MSILRRLVLRCRNMSSREAIGTQRYCCRNEKTRTQKEKKLMALRKHFHLESQHRSKCRINTEMATVENREVKSYKHELRQYSFYGSCYSNS